MSGSRASTPPVLQQTIGTLSLIETSVPARAYVDLIWQADVTTADRSGELDLNAVQRPGRAGLVFRGASQANGKRLLKSLLGTEPYLPLDDRLKLSPKYGLRNTSQS